MKWTKKHHKIGEKRIQSGFLWFPESLDGIHWRWLEEAKWTEEYVFYYGMTEPLWKKLNWEDDYNK